MTRNPLKLLAYSSAAVLASCLNSNLAMAQVTQAVSATLITSSAITVAKVSDMDFGTWLIQFVDQTPTITLTNDGTATTAQGGTLGNSIVTEITDGATEGVVNVQTPAATTVTMARGNITDFTGGNGISLTTINYDTDHTTTAALAANTPVNITVSAANANETINLGGVVAITGTPADATYTATFTLTFDY